MGDDTISWFETALPTTKTSPTTPPHHEGRKRTDELTGPLPASIASPPPAVTRTTLMLLVAMTGVAPIALYMLVPALSIPQIVI